MLNTFPITVWTTTENWIYTPNSTVVNEVRFGYNRMTIAQDSLDAGLPFPVNTGLTSGTPGWPNIAIKGFNSFGTQHNRPQVSGPNPYSDYQENLSYLKGKHSFKFGIEYGRIEGDSNIPDTGRGKFVFNGGKASSLGIAFNAPCAIGQPPPCGSSTPLEDLMAGDLTNGVALVGNADRKMHWSETAGFAQDDWRITPKVTLNFGLRYSYESPIKEVNNNWANFDPTSITGLVQQGASGASTLWRPDNTDLSPRIGFAWDVFGEGNNGRPRRLQHHVLDVHRGHVDESKHVPEQHGSLHRCQSNWGFDSMRRRNSRRADVSCHWWWQYSARLCHARCVKVVLGSNLSSSLRPSQPRPDNGISKRRKFNLWRWHWLRRRSLQSLGRGSEPQDALRREL